MPKHFLPFLRSRNLYISKKKISSVPQKSREIFVVSRYSLSHHSSPVLSCSSGHAVSTYAGNRSKIPSILLDVTSYTMVHRKHRIKDIYASWKREVIERRPSVDGVDNATSNFIGEESSLLPKPLDWLKRKIAQSYDSWKRRRITTNNTTLSMLFCLKADAAQYRDRVFYLSIYL